MTDHADRARKHLTSAPQAGSVDYGQVQALTGIGWALLALLEHIAPSNEEDDRG